MFLLFRDDDDDDDDDDVRITNHGAVPWSYKTSRLADHPSQCTVHQTSQTVFSLTTNQPEQCFSAKFQTSKQGPSGD